MNVPEAKEIAIVDRNKRGVIARWGTGSVFANFPMAMDERAQRLFVVCRHPARLLCLDLNSGKIIQELPSVGDADDIFYDTDRRQLYVTGGEGAVSTYVEQGTAMLRQIGRTSTAPGARTSLLVSQWNRLFVAAPQRGSQSARLLEFEIE